MNYRWLFVVSIVVVFLGACSLAPQETTISVEPTHTQTLITNTPKPSATSIPTVTSSPTSIDEVFILQESPTPNPYYTATPGLEEVIASNMNPLTGKNVDEEQNLFRRPVMVKISNYPRDIRPQAGWAMADIMFEYYLGEGMNRFLAIFYGENPLWAGPIRSGRLVDAQLGMMYESILVYGGADDRVDTILKDPSILGDRAIDTRYTEICPPICGEDTHSLEGVFVDTSAMSSYAYQNGIDDGVKFDSLTEMQFSETAPTSELTGTDIWITISDVCESRWMYEASKGYYLRWEESEDFEEKMVPSTDKLVEDEQLAYENIVVLFSDYIVYDVMLHDIAVVFEGDLLPAMMWRDGLAYSGTWSAEENVPLKVWDANGKAYKFSPGRTWFIFVTEDSTVETLDQGGWQVMFSRP